MKSAKKTKVIQSDKSTKETKFSEKHSIKITVKILLWLVGAAALMWAVFLGDVYNRYIKPFVFPPVKVYPSEIEFDRNYESQSQILYVSNVSGEDQLYVNIALVMKDKDNDADYNEFNIRVDPDIKSNHRNKDQIDVDNMKLLVLPSIYSIHDKDMYKTIRLVFPILKKGKTERIVITYKRNFNSKKSGFLRLSTKFLQGPFDGPRLISVKTSKEPVEVDPFKIHTNKIKQYKYRNKVVKAFLDDNKKVWFIAEPVLNILNLNLTKDIVNLGPGNKTNVTIISNEGKELDKVIIISEAGFHKLVEISKMPDAKDFQKWLFTEVLAYIYK